MRYIAVVIFLFCAHLINGQTLTELESKREKALEDIKYLNNMLVKTSNQKSSGIQGLNMVNRKLEKREDIISGIITQIDLLKRRIKLNEEAIVLMEGDLRILISDYEKAVMNAQKLSKGQPGFAYIFSAKDINQGYKRMKYLQQIAKYRRKEAELIGEIKEVVEANKKKQESDLEEIIQLQVNEEIQKVELQKEKKEQQRIIRDLAKKEKQLKKDLKRKERIAKEIEKEIERIIEAERRKREISEVTPEEKLVGDNFRKNKGLLPWPVEKGIITSRYGIHDHPVFKGTKVDNIGIEITSGQMVVARAVFEGKVASVFGISGGNMAVIVRHGEFLTVYQNLINVKVKPGDEVSLKQVLGDVFQDNSIGGKFVVKFMIFQEKEKRNPEEWLAKRK